MNLGLGTLVLGLACLVVSCASYDIRVDYRAQLEPFATSTGDRPLAPSAFAIPSAWLPDEALPSRSASVVQDAEALMHWLGKRVTFDGSSRPPAPLNAATIWTAARSGKGLNCLAASTLWASLAQGWGLSTRVLSLFPRDLSDENHVVVLVWDPAASDWLVADPSYQALFYGPDGRAWGPLELREALRLGRTIRLSEQASWNGGSVEPNYLHYLSKNLYRWSVPRADGGRINLNPPSFGGWGPPWGFATIVRDPHVFLVGPRPDQET